jgi:sRNA-binding regulator protein Hfq
MQHGMQQGGDKCSIPINQLPDIESVLEGWKKSNTPIAIYTTSGRVLNGVIGEIAAGYFEVLNLRDNSKAIINLAQIVTICANDTK